ncbi:MAG TPA: glycosyltransferase family 2 protein [Patescibacteria group bacterium]|nr:glycosyltransferase family 2 protein [Patescibacteria group bacterium]
MLTSLSVFFPAFNEAENLEKLLAQAHDVLPTIARQFEVIVINDGSTDNTKAVVRKLQEKYDWLRILSHKTNLGYGAALKTGIEACTFDWTFWSDSDLQFDLHTLTTFLQYTGKYDAIIGYRAHRADTLLRKINGELYTRLINLLFDMKVRDIDCAFKLIKTSLLHESLITSASAFTSAEILIRLQRKHVKLMQLPVQHYKRRNGTPTGGSLRVIFKGLRETLSFFLSSRK